MPLIGPGANLDRTPAGFHPDDPAQINFLEASGSGPDGPNKLIAHGEPAQMLINNGMDLNVLRPYIASNGRAYVNSGHTINAEGKKIPRALATNAATLRQDEWKQIDTTVLQVARKRLRFYQMLVSAGLTFPLPNALGTTVLGWDKMQDDDGTARITMAPDIPPEEGRVTFERDYVPIPVVCKGFRMNSRELEESRRLGTPLNTLNIEQSVRQVTTAIEQLALVGTGGITYGGGTIQGALNYTHRITGPLTAAWTASAADPVSDVINMKQDSIDAYHHGPWALMTPLGYETSLDEDYSPTTADPRTLRQRLLAIDGINSINTMDYMTAGSVLLMELDSMTVRMIVGFEPRTVQWSGMGGFALYFMIIAILVPNFRADANNKCGIIHYSA